MPTSQGRPNTWGGAPRPPGTAWRGRAGRPAGACQTALGEREKNQMAKITDQKIVSKSPGKKKKKKKSDGKNYKSKRLWQNKRRVVPPLSRVFNSKILHYILDLFNHHYYLLWMNDEHTFICADGRLLLLILSIIKEWKKRAMFQSSKKRSMFNHQRKGQCFTQHQRKK